MRCAVVALALGLMAGPGQAAEFATLKGHGGPVMGIAVHAEGQVATASFDNSVGLWRNGAPDWLDGHAAAVTALDFAPDGTVVSGGDDFAVIHWQGGAATELGRHTGKVQSVAISPDGSVAATASWDGTVGLWPLDGGAPRSIGPLRAGANAVTWAPDGTLYAATMDGEILAIGPDDAPRSLLREGFGVNELVSGEGWLAYGTVDGATRIVDPATGAALHDFTLERRPILSMAYHADTDQLAVGDGDGWIMVLDTAAWEIARDFRATRQGPVWALAYAPSGDVLYAGGLDDVAYAWPVESLDEYAGSIEGERSFLRDPATMPNGERQFMRKCSICHALEAGPSRKAGPSLHGLFGRPAGSIAGYGYSETLSESTLVWNATTIDALFDQGPDHYIPGSKMPMQVIAGAQDRADLIDFLRSATE